MMNTEEGRPEDTVESLFSAQPMRPDRGQQALPLAPWTQKGEWRVCPYSHGRLALFPPDSLPTWLESYVKESHLFGPPPRVPMVILGAPGSGLSTFSHWVSGQVSGSGANDEPLLRVDLATAGDDRDERSQAIAIRGMFARAYGDTLAGSDAANLTGLVDKYLAGDGWAGDRAGPRCVLITHLARLHPENAKTLLGRIRDRAESGGLDGPQVIFLASDPKLLTTLPFSHILDVADTYRLGDLLVQDVESMWETHGKQKRIDSADLARECIEWTGGNPLLVQIFLRHMDQSDVQLKDAGPWLLEHAPESTLASWRSDLARLTITDAAARRKMQAFVAGRTESDVWQSMGDLFVAGWIGPNERGRWTVRSKCHAQWAQEPLRHPERFLEPKARQ